MFCVETTAVYIKVRLFPSKTLLLEIIQYNGSPPVNTLRPPANHIMSWLKKIYEPKGETPTNDLFDLHTPSWNDLPFEVLLEVYCLLPSRDRFNMSLTCKQWLSSFLHPRIWRRGHFLLNSRLNRRKLRMPERVMLALRSLSVDFSGPKRLTARSFPRIGEFLTSLKRVGNNSLESLSIVDLSCCYNLAILAHLTPVFTFQRELKTLRFVHIGLLLTADFVTELLTTVSVNCADTLEQLEVRDELSMINADMLKLQGVLTRLTRLSEFSVSYDFLSDEVLISLPGTLKLIRIWSTYDDGYVSDIDIATLSAPWKILATKLPTLRAEYHVSDVENVVYLMKVLPQGVPLTCLHWQSKRNYVKKNTEYCLKYIMDTFENLLELHINVRIHLLNETGVVTTVERLPILKTFTICQKPRKKRRFYIQNLEQALGDLLARCPCRRLAKTNITITHSLKNTKDVITVSDWTAALGDLTL